MPKTVVGLFENPRVVDEAVRDIAALGFPVQQVRTIEEPASFEVSSVMSFPRVDFETELGRELTRTGATIPETQAYIAGLRRGGGAGLRHRIGRRRVRRLKSDEPAWGVGGG